MDSVSVFVGNVFVVMAGNGMVMYDGISSWNLIRF